MSSRVGVVIVAYDSADVLGELLESLAEHEPKSPVVVVDDATPDGPPPVGKAELVVQDTNRGFAASCNRGVEVIRRHDIRYVAFLNPDVRLQGPSLSELVRHLGRRRKIGIATGPLQTPDGHRLPSAWGPTSVRRAFAFAAGLEPQRLRAAAGTMLRPRLTTKGAAPVVDDLRVEGHVIGGTMISRLKTFDDVGGFDEDFFLYWEDADYCHRARGLGWDVRVLPCTPFVHAEGSLSSISVTDEQRWGWFVEGATRFGVKHLVPGQARQLEAALELGRRLGRLRQRG